MKRSLCMVVSLTSVDFMLISTLESSIRSNLAMNPEELKHLLFRLSIELELTRSTAKEEIKLHEEYTNHLMNLLTVTCHERDEAREQCQKLQEKLLQKGLNELQSGLQPDSPAGRSNKGDSSVTECESNSGSYKHHSFVSSPGQSMFDTVSSIQEPSKPNLADSTGMDLLPNSFFSFSEDYQQSSFPTHNLQPMHLAVGCTADRIDSSKLELDQKYISNPSNLPELPHSYMSACMQDIESQPILHGSASFTESNTQSQNNSLMQASTAMKSPSSCGADVKCQKQQELSNAQKHTNQKSSSSKPHPQQQTVDHDAPSKGESQERDVTQKPSQQVQPDNTKVSEKIHRSSTVNSCSQTNAETETLPNHLAADPIVTNTKPNVSFPQVVNVTSNMMMNLKEFREPASSMVPLHLPEPPEADPQVIMKSLPERGKLLEAVMKAGPLLQTLLLAGPLPQWRHPPPPLESFEIPLVSIPTSSVINPLLCPPPLTTPVRNGVQIVPSSATGYTLANQSTLSQTQVVSLLQAPTTSSTNIAPNKRAFINSACGHFAHDPRPPSKLAKMQQ